VGVGVVAWVWGSLRGCVGRCVGVGARYTSNSTNKCQNNEIKHVILSDAEG